MLRLYKYVDKQGQGWLSECDEASWINQGVWPTIAQKAISKMQQIP